MHSSDGTHAGVAECVARLSFGDHVHSGGLVSWRQRLVECAVADYFCVARARYAHRCGGIRAPCCGGVRLANARRNIGSQEHAGCRTHKTQENRRAVGKLRLLSDTESTHAHQSNRRVCTPIRCWSVAFMAYVDVVSQVRGLVLPSFSDRAKNEARGTMVAGTTAVPVL